MTRGVLGRMERGKTTLAYYLASKLPRRLIFDSRGDIRRPGAVIARNAAALEHAIDALADDEISEVVYVPREHLKTIAFPKFAAEVKRWVEHLRDEPLAVFVDEITFVNILDPDFEWAWKCCRKDRVHFFFTSHRPIDVPVDIRANTDHWYLFQAVQPHDLEVIAEQCSPATAAAVSRLQGSEFVRWNVARGEFTEHKDPSAWYIDLAPGRPVAAPLELS